MAWQIAFREKALKSLQRFETKRQENIRKNCTALIEFLNRGILPFQYMDIKRLSGEWQGFMRLRIGKIRLIFRLEFIEKTIYIYKIDFRGGVY